MIRYEVTERKTDKYIVRIRKPILTAEERNLREENTKAALVQFGREKLRGVN